MSIKMNEFEKSGKISDYKRLTAEYESAENEVTKAIKKIDECVKERSVSCSRCDEDERLGGCPLRSTFRRKHNRRIGAANELAWFAWANRELLNELLNGIEIK